MLGLKEYNIPLELTNFCNQCTVSDILLPGKICGLPKVPITFHFLQ